MNIDEEFELIAQNFIQLKNLSNKVQLMIDICLVCLKNGNKIMFCGNGGSASQSQHLAAELVGRYKKNRPAMNSLSLTVDTSIITAVGNDYGYDDVFRRQIEGVGKSGDVLIGLSTSGNSQNVVIAFEEALKKGIKTIALTGSKPSLMSASADLTLAVPSTISNSIQEMHLAIGHLVCGELERLFYEE